MTRYDKTETTRRRGTGHGAWDGGYLFEFRVGNDVKHGHVKARGREHTVVGRENRVRGKGILNRTHDGIKRFVFLQRAHGRQAKVRGDRAVGVEFTRIFGRSHDRRRAS